MERYGDSMKKVTAMERHGDSMKVGGEGRLPLWRGMEIA